MREILFRGKNVDNGAWVYGSFIPDMLEVFCITDIDGFIKPFSLNKEELTEVRAERSTVGQFTGLTDKNGTKIFEGDIVKTKYGRLCKVCWFSSPCSQCWDLIPIENKYKFADEYDLWIPKNLEVIGNVHDNPELLTQ